MIALPAALSGLDESCDELASSRQSTTTSRGNSHVSMHRIANDRAYRTDANTYAKPQMVEPISRTR